MLSFMLHFVSMMGEKYHAIFDIFFVVISGGKQQPVIIKLGAGDQIQITVYGESDLSSQS